MSKSVDGGGDFAVPSGKRRSTNKKPAASTAAAGGGGGALNDLFEKTKANVTSSMAGEDRGNRGVYSSTSTKLQQQGPSKDRICTTAKRRNDQQLRSVSSSSGGACSDQPQQSGGGTTTSAVPNRYAAPSAPGRNTFPSRGGRAVGSTSSSIASGGASTTSANCGNNSNNSNSSNNRPKKKSPANKPKDKLDSFLERKSQDSSKNVMDSDDRSRGAQSTATHLRSKKSRTRVVKRTISDEDGAVATTSTAVAALYNSRAATSSASPSPCATTTTATTTVAAHASARATRRGSAGGAIAAFGRRLSASGAAAGFGNILHGHGHNADSSSQNNINTSINSNAAGPNLGDSTHSSTGPATGTATATATDAHTPGTRRGSAGGAIVAFGRRLSASGAAAGFGNILHGHGHNAELSSQNNTMSNSNAAGSNLNDSTHSGTAGRATSRESPGGGGTTFTPATRQGIASSGTVGNVAAFGRRMSIGGGAAVAALTSTVAEVEKSLTSTAAAVEKKLEKNLGSFLKLQKPRVKEDLETRSAFTTGDINRRHRMHTNSKKSTPLPSTKEELIECLRSGSNSNNNITRKKKAPVAKLTNDPRKTASRAISPKAHRIGDLDSPSRPQLQKQQSLRQRPPVHRMEDMMNHGNGNTDTTSAARPNLQKHQSLRQRPPPQRCLKCPSNATLTTNKDRAGVSGNAESSSLQRPNPNKHPGLAARGGTKSFDDAVLSPETARKKKLIGGQSRPRGARQPAITPDATSRSRPTITTSKDLRNGDNTTLRSGQQKPPQRKQKPNTGKKGEGGPPRIPNRTRSQLQVSARRMHTTHVTMQSPRPATRGKIDIAAEIATPKASNKQSVYMMDSATPKVNNTAARRKVNTQDGTAHHQSSDEEATPKIGNTSKRLPKSSAGGTSIPTLSSLNEYDDCDDNNNNQIATTPPVSPHQREVVRDFSPSRPVRREPERLQEEEEPVAESNPEDVFSFYTWSKARQPVNKVQAERQVLKEIILDGPLDSPFDIQTTGSRQSPRK